MSEPIRIMPPEGCHCGHPIIISGGIPCTTAKSIQGVCICVGGGCGMLWLFDCLLAILNDNFLSEYLRRVWTRVYLVG